MTEKQHIAERISNKYTNTLDEKVDYSIKKEIENVVELNNGELICTIIISGEKGIINPISLDDAKHVAKNVSIDSKNISVINTVTYRDGRKKINLSIVEE